MSTVRFGIMRFEEKMNRMRAENQRKNVLRTGYMNLLSTDMLKSPGSQIQLMNFQSRNRI